jgi:hypothetical protein
MPPFRFAPSPTFSNGSAPFAPTNYSPAKFEGKPTDTAPCKPTGRAYPLAPAYRRPPIDVLCLTVPIVFYTQTVPGLGAHARSSPGAWGTAPSGRRERGKNTARRPKNGRPTGLSKSCTRPFNAPQARGRARSRPRPSPRLLWSGHFSTHHARAAEACRPVSCRSSYKRGSPPSLRDGAATRRRPDSAHGMGRRPEASCEELERVDPGLPPQIIGGRRRTLSGGGVSASQNERNFRWLCSTHERTSSPRNTVHSPPRRVTWGAQTQASASCLSRQNRRQTTLKSQSRVRHDTVDNSGDDRYNPLLQILFFGIWASKIRDLANPAGTGPYLDVTRSLRACPDLRRRSSHAFAIHCRRDARGTISLLGYANRGAILPDRWFARA